MVWRCDVCNQKELAEVQAKLSQAVEVIRWYADDGNYTCDFQGNEIASAFENHGMQKKAREFLLDIGVLLQHGRPSRSPDTPAREWTLNVRYDGTVRGVGRPSSSGLVTELGAFYSDNQDIRVREVLAEKDSSQKYCLPCASDQCRLHAAKERKIR